MRISCASANELESFCQLVANLAFPTPRDARSSPYSNTAAYCCRQNTANPSQYSVHSEGRAIDFFIPTWPCSSKLVPAGARYFGHPTCATWPGGAARNDLGDRLAMWLAENAEAIGVEFLIYDRTKWSRRYGWRPYTGAHPHNEHVHIELTRLAAATKNPGGTLQNFYSNPLDYAPRAEVLAPLPISQSAVPGSYGNEAAGGGGRRLSESTVSDLSALEVENAVVGEETSPPDGSLLTVAISNARFATRADGSLATTSAFGGTSAALELVFDVTIELSGAISCPRHNVGVDPVTGVARDASGPFTIPFTQAGVRLGILPVVPIDCTSCADAPG